MNNTDSNNNVNADILTGFLFLISFIMIIVVYQLVIKKKTKKIRPYNNNTIHPLREIYKNKVDIDNHKLKIENHKVGIDNHKVGIDNRKVGIENNKVEI